MKSIIKATWIIGSIFLINYMTFEYTPSWWYNTMLSFVYFNTIAAVSTAVIALLEKLGP